MPYKGLPPYGTFAVGSLLECGGLNPILPFLEERSDAARRVATVFESWDCVVETDSPVRGRAP